MIISLKKKISQYTLFRLIKKYRVLCTLENIFTWSVIINNTLTMDSYLVSHHITGTVNTTSFQCMGCMSSVICSSVCVITPMCIISRLMNMSWYIVTYIVEVKWIRDMKSIDENIIFMKLRVYGEQVRRVWVLCTKSNCCSLL